MKYFLASINLKSNPIFRLVKADTEEEALVKARAYRDKEAADLVIGFYWKEAEVTIFSTIE